MRFRLRRKKSRPLTVTAAPPLEQQFPDIATEVLSIIRSVQNCTMTSPERLIALCDAVDYVSREQIAGDIVECGVWRGGSMMAAASRLMQHSDTSRNLWLYDTFDGMSEPGDADIDHDGNNASSLLAEQDKQDEKSIWCWSPLNDVKQNLAATGFPPDQTRFIQGKVEETIPVRVPDRISLLRLDTDWYESTMHELIHLFPRLTPGGVLIIDDYGHWQGCRRAVDDYFRKNNISIFLNRIDYTGRLAIKTGELPADRDKSRRAA